MKREWFVAAICAAVSLASAAPASGQDRDVTVVGSDSVRQVTLDQAVRIARALNPELRVAESNVDVAEYNSSSSRDATTCSRASGSSPS
jgi:hypothetical protein